MNARRSSLGLLLALGLLARAANGTDQTANAVARLLEAQREAIHDLRASEGLLEHELKAAERDAAQSNDKEIKKAQATVDRLQGNVARLKKQRRSTAPTDKLLEKAQSQLHELKSETTRRDGRVSTVRNQLGAVQMRLAVAEAGEVPREPLVQAGGPRGGFLPVKIGDVGTLQGWDTKILQILDSDRMLISVSCKIDSVIMLLVSPTKGLTDDSELDSRTGRLFVATETYKYGTAAGSTNTVMKIEALDLDALQAAIEKQKPGKPRIADGR